MRDAELNRNVLDIVAAVPSIFILFLVIVSIDDTPLWWFVVGSMEVI